MIEVFNPSMLVDTDRVLSQVVPPKLAETLKS